MTLTDTVLQNVIRKLIKNQDYRIEVVTLIDAEFLQYAVDFFGQVVQAKLKSTTIGSEWYRDELLKSGLSKEDLAINSGLNMKTIQNMYNSTTRTVVLDAAVEHYEALCSTVNSLVESGKDININLSIKFHGVSVDLNLNESLIVINTLAVKRAALRGGLWSTAGKRAEKPLLTTLCQLFNVPVKYYDRKQWPYTVRETDFYLFTGGTKNYKCEVKLMGKGNPESADAVFARDANILVADKLSDTNKRQLSHRGIEWVELRSKRGYKKFFEILNHIAIPATEFSGTLDKRLDEILADIFG
ncbi:MAG: CfrBI family restriction endonuclease [Chloroflexi bacterium]|nr:CfrBI family restriction endonuclease [Chloroflexota bacterium]